MAKKTDGNGAAVEKPQLFKQTYDNMFRIFVPAREPGEDDAAYRRRLDPAVQQICGKRIAQLKFEKGADKKNPTVTQILVAAIAERLGVASSTVRAYQSVRRRVDRDCRKFFEDYAEFGGARFTQTGALVKSSRRANPDTSRVYEAMDEYFKSTPAGV